jgi:DNA-binding MarR family transcriptional regulator
MSATHSSVRKYISMLYRHGQSYMSKRLGYLNIGSGQYIFLTTLFKKAGISQEELSNELKIDKATTAKAIKKLEDEGYVVREIDSKDKRAYKLSLSPKGLEAIPLIQDAANDWEKIITSGLSEKEYQWAEEILSVMAKNSCQLKR